ncbi:glycoside hydrolase family 2 TIM barrel-domain containing protein [Streptomyces massasporeus]|uniref:glycoside hydrolase family 2 TIM barrel-domain containing protein n=1 Tax=Streptomyces massasporeus TaxID=67324 RepID=UPI0033C3B3F2
MNSSGRRSAAGTLAALTALVLGSFAALTALVLGSFAAPPVIAAPLANPQETAARGAAADALFDDDFSDGLTRWIRTETPAGGPDWAVKDAAATVDTTASSTGSYLRPSGALTLPASYELTTRVRADDIRPDGSVTFVLDMQDPDDPTTKDIAAQITGVKPDGRAGVRISAPLSGSTRCSGDSPVTTGDWLDVRIVRAGGVTAVYFGGRLSATTASPTAGGTFALGSFHSKVSIGAVTVRSLAGAPAGHPGTASGCTWKAPDQDAPGHQVTKGNPTQSLNGAWAFRPDPDDEGETAGKEWWSSSADTSGWGTMPVPGNWETRDEYTDFRGKGWYRRTFTVANSGNAYSRFRLDIGACNWECSVWVNDTRIKVPELTQDATGDSESWGESDTHQGGYTPFRLDVTSALRKTGTNTVVVRADNTKAVGAWWPWGGLSRDVGLTTTQSLVITRQEITATPDLTAGTATVSSKVYLRNTGSGDQRVTVGGDITSASTGANVPGGTGLTATATVPAGESAAVTLRTSLDRDTFSLWRLDDPKLYRLGVTLATAAAPGTVVHGISDAFGVRKLEIKGTDVLFNGEKVKMAGGNRVADNPVNGNTEPVAQIRHDMDLMKSGGMSLMRIGHHAQSPALLDYADRIGMLLIAEVPVWGDKADLTMSTGVPLAKQMMTEMVGSDFNHPSIFAWSVANEIQSGSTAGRTYDQKMAAFAKRIDPTRFVTQASNKIHGNWSLDPASDGTQYMDFASINVYGGFDGAVKTVNNVYKDKPVYVTEFNDYLPSATKPFPTSRESIDFAAGPASAVGGMADKSYVFGWSQWSFNDYRSPAQSSSPNRVRGFGQVDVWGRPKASYEAMRAVNAPVKSLELSTPKTADGTAGATATVTPRGPLGTSGPSWKLKDYRLAVRVTDASGEVTGGTVADLPDIAPGDAALRVPLSWKHSASAVTVRLSLLSPQGFQEAVTTVDLTAPAKPEITSTATASGSVRVRIGGTADGLKHTVTATAPDGTVAATRTTSEPFADLTGLTNGTPYEIAVRAVNAAGDSEPATTTLTPGGELPAGPDIVRVTPVAKGLVIGYSEETPADQIAGAEFRVAVTGTSSGTRTYTTTARPGTRIEGLTPGETYSVRVQRDTPGASSTPLTAWSETVKATVPATGEAPRLHVQGTIGGPTSGAIAVDPAPGTIRYEVTVGNGKPFTVDRSAVDLIRVDHLKPGTSHPVTVKAVGPDSTSPAWSGTLTTTVAPPTDVEITGAQGARKLTWTPPSPAPDSYTVTRAACGTSTTRKVAGDADELELGADGGSYTVQALSGSTLSARSERLGTGGDTDCGFIAGVTDTTARADGSHPFGTTGTWTASALITQDGYPTTYATATASPAPRAKWTAPATGSASTHKVEIALPGGASSASVTYTIETATGKQTRTINQNTAADGWVDLGTYDFSASQAPNVAITATGQGIVRASAARFTRAG